MRFRIMDDPICYEFRQDIARPQVAKIVRVFCSAQRMQLLPWSAYLPDMSPIEHMWDLVGRNFARDLSCSFERRPVAAHTSNIGSSSTSRH
ncbi:hypothetical protein TNCV_2494651 [Trichonephila clavipes]|uniref:Tc1-like transposase DDE domain-containing protein n=1 Tax=Trichonephila clavipes TaxID=2585209 RepID=A0A8X6VAR7_TRICX|nr:hypothetical protein TNCV_2494651 [Trichonephila clavipes]